jgi:filamentous hemagglutinin family protein
MNHIYRSIWSDALNTWIAVAEHTKTKGKRSTTRNALLATGLLCCTPVSWALPTGEQLVAGQAIVNTPAANQMQIQQTSQQAIINWQGFSIQQNEAVNIQQPNANAALLNRVVGQDASQIQGQLNANGQVYLVNPNGVVFGKTAQVDVGGLIASTHNISDTDFLNGKNHFTQNGATGSVDNQGNIKTPDGGIVALISERVSNSGTINTPKGTSALAAGKTVDLDFQGNGLVEVKVPEAALNAQINNQGAIQADGGRVVLTAKAAGQLIDTVINQQGIIRAQSMVERNGEIILDGGDNGIVQVSGTLDVESSNQGLNSNTTGGNITVKGADIQLVNSANINASGNTGGGTINVLADMNNGTVNVAGKLDASAPNNGNGGFIETSAAHVKIADSAKVTTKANNGTSGNWLIDPVDFTIAAVGGDMTGAAVSAALLGGNFIIQSTTGAGGVNGDVNVNDVVTWAANTLTLNAQNNININANMNASGLARLDLLYGQGALAAGNTSYIITKAGASVNLPAGTTNFTTKQGSDGVVQNYTVITDLGAPNSVTTTDLQGMNGGLSLNYALGANIDASATGAGGIWGSTGFTPIGHFPNAYIGNFEGLGHIITGLTINQPSLSDVGLFGRSNSISNLGLIGVSIVGSQFVGGLTGGNAGIINNCYATGNVIGNRYVGGLVGESIVNITNSYAIGNVTGSSEVGGLLGKQTSGSITNSYASGNVLATTQFAGGLVGWHFIGDISNSYATGNVTSPLSAGGLVGADDITSWVISNSYYATGSVTSTGSTVGGLVGASTAGITFNNVYWNIQSSGQSNAGYNPFGSNVGATGITTAQLQQMSTFTNWSISNSGGSSAVWRIYEGNTAPLLRSFLTPLIANTSISETYTGLVHNSINSVSYTIDPIFGPVNPARLFSTTTPYGNAINVGSYSLTGLYSDQQGYDISVVGALNITPAPLTITANPFSKVYDGLNYAGGNDVTYTGFVNGETSSVLTGSLSYAGNSQGARNVGVYDISPTGLSASNYSINYVNNTLSIIPADITLVSDNIVKFFDGTTFTTGTPLVVNGSLFSPDSFVSGLFRFTDPKIGINKTVTLSNVLINDGNGGKNYNITYIDNTSGRIIEPSTIYVDNISSLIKSATGIDWLRMKLPVTTALDAITDMGGDSSLDSELSVLDSSAKFSGSGQSNPLFNFFGIPEDGQKPILPVLQIKNGSGLVKLLKMSNDKQFLSMLLEDGSVRIWDFQSGTQRQIDLLDKKQIIADISAVNDNGESQLIASDTGVGVYDAFSAASDDQFTVHKPDIGHFASSSDGRLLLISTGTNTNKLSVWDNKQNKERWQTDYERGAVKNLALSHDKHYGAVLSTQPGVYEMTSDKKTRPLTDAVDIIDMATGKILSALPNFGEQVIHIHFKDDDTLQLGLASGKLLDWSVTTGKQKTVVNFAENIIDLDNNQDTYAYIAKNGTVRVGNNPDAIHLSIQNKDNPFKYAQLLDKGKKLLTVLATGDLALWDVESGKKMLRLFSTKQGWTVMDAFGRFDGSEQAMENFSWLANQEDIPLDSFSENYYEPGLLTSLLQNQDLLNQNPDMVAEGISLPPKIDLQLAEQQSKDDKVTVKLDVYDRGGGVDKINLYHNGKLLANNNQTNLETQQEGNNEHRSSTLNISPSAGKNTLKVIANNNMGIENSSAELSFDGKSKAYSSSIHLLTIGINQYSDAQLNLNYSVADANSIEQALKNQSSITSSKRLTDEKATKPQILAELRKLSQGAQQDSLIIYFAGHGIAVDKEWYFLPYETKLQPTPEKIAASGITATELGDIFKDSKIQHIMLVVDSCYSGAGVDAFKFKKLENNQRYFARKMSRTMGITVIAATAKDQEASELESLGHGLFTYALTQELQKKDNNTPLTAHNIADSIVKTLPAFSKKMLGFTQDPVVFTKGSDFTLGDTGNNKKAGDK